MKPRALLVFLATALLNASPVIAQGLEAGFDSRIDLLSIVFRLAGNPEYNQCRLPGYEAAIDSWFRPYRDHEAVRRARELRSAIGMGFDGPMSLAVHLTDPPRLEPRVNLASDTSALDQRWRRTDPAPFLEALRRFAGETRYPEFAASQRQIEDSATARLRRFAETNIDLGWYPRFFGTAPAAVFKLVPGLCNGGANYGPRFASQEEGLELYAILGVNADSSGWPAFNTGMLPTLIHEFNHSFVNPVMETERARFEGSVPRVYERVAADMRSLAYGRWETMLAESRVRAAVVRYLGEHRGAEAARGEIVEQQGVGFVWMEELVGQLARYERERHRYPTFQSFVPSVASYFDDLAGRIDRLVDSLAGRGPGVVTFSPSNDAVDVDPATTEIVIRFDRPMSGGYSIQFGAGGQASYPADAPGRAFGFDSTKTTFTWRVQLQPDRRYEMVFTGRGFRSQEGFPLRRVTYAFRTGKAR